MQKGVDVRLDELHTAGDIDHRGAERLSIRREIDVVDVVAVVESEDRFPFVVRLRNDDENRAAVVMLDRPDRLIDRIDDQVACPAILQQHSPPAAVEIELVQIAPASGVVRRVENLAALWIVGHRRDEVERRGDDIGQRRHLSRRDIDGHDLRWPGGPIDRRVEQVAIGIVEAAGDGTENCAVDACFGRDRILPDPREVGLLPLMLPRDPALPFSIERRTEDILEL